jgi:DNA-binding response OmpR family regulator
VNNYQNLATKQPVAQVRDYRILVVEDDDTMSLLMASVLTGYGYCVDIAEDGADGWEALHATAYDLLITDNAMPRVSGLELVHQMRVAHMTLPVVLASGMIPAEVQNGKSELNITATLLKPFTAEALLRTVNGILWNRGAGTESPIECNLALDHAHHA